MGSCASLSYEKETVAEISFSKPCRTCNNTYFVIYHKSPNGNLYCSPSCVKGHYINILVSLKENHFL